MEARKEARKQVMNNAILKENNKDCNAVKRKETRKNSNTKKEEKESKKPSPE